MKILIKSNIKKNLEKKKPNKFLEEWLSAEHKIKKYRKILKIIYLIQNHSNGDFKVKKQKGYEILMVFTYH